MSASVKDSLPSSLPGAAGGGAHGGDDGDGPSRRKYRGDPMPEFDPNEEEEEEDDDDDDDDGGDSAAESSPTPPPSGRRWRQSQQQQQQHAASEFCRVCHRGFASAKALHGHMRSHPQRTWRGVLPPSMRPGREREVADSLILLSGKGHVAERQRYPCKVCGREFETRQALGGHRASHKSRGGCYARAEAGRPAQRPLCEEEGCAAESSAPAAGPSTSRTSAGASTSTRTVVQTAATTAAAASKLEQETSEVVTRRRRRRRRRGRRALDLNEMPQSSDSTTGEGS